MDFRIKVRLPSPWGFIPWFEVPWRRSAESVLITGHWSALGLKIMPNLANRFRIACGVVR